MNGIGIKWKSKDLSNRKVLHIIFRNLSEQTNKYVYFHIQRRLTNANDLIAAFHNNEYRILRKYNNLFYIEEVDAHIEDTWYAITSAIDKLKRKLNDNV